MLTMLHAPTSSAASAWFVERIDSSRQSGVVSARGEVGVGAQLVGRVRLLDHQQAEPVERRHHVGIVRRVAGVRVDLQGEIGERIAHRTHRVDVPSRHDLELHPPVAVGHVPAHLVDQLVDGGGDAHRHADVDVRRGATKTIGERAPLGTQFGVEDGHLQTRLRGAISLHLAARRPDGVAGDLGELQHCRHQPSAQHHQRGLGELLVVERLGVRSALAPPFADVGDHADEQHVARLLHTEAGAERSHQRHGHTDRFDVFDPRHTGPLST